MREVIKRYVNLSIRQKIIGSFAFLLSISLITTVFNIYGLEKFHHHFQQFQKESVDTNLMLKVDKNISDLQRYILAYSNTEKGFSSDQLRNIQKQLSKDIAQLIATADAEDDVYRSQLEQLKKTTDSFSERIDSLEKERAFRDVLVNQVLLTSFDRIDIKLDELFLLTEKSGNYVIKKSIWNIHNAVAKAESLSSRYFVKREFKLRRDVEALLSEAVSQLKRLATPLKSEGQFHIAQDIKALEETRTQFTQAVQADRNYLFLVNVVIAGETAELNSVSETLKAAKLEKQSKLVSATEQNIEWLQLVELLISLAGALVAVIIALLMATTLSKSLLSITQTFSRLVSGENVAEIPGMERRDEIGKLAQAANIFRETNVKTQELLAHSERLADDLTQREKALELAVDRAQEANLAKSQFLANMSHELRTPMNAILGMLSLLKNTALNVRQTDYVTKTESAARSLLSLLNDILDISKAEAGKIDLDPIPFSLDTLIADLNTLLSASLGEKSIGLQFVVDENVPRYLRGDPYRLRQILINLGGNAIKFTEQGGVVIAITKELSSDNNLLAFSVKDTGIGIARESQEKIFSSFTQAESSTTRRFGGTGLGLAISQKLVELMGGELKLESELGKGSCFYFSINLPVLTTDEIAELEAKLNADKLAQGTNRLAGLRILLVEDNLTNQQIAAELLEAEGAKITIANHGQEAIDILSANLRENNVTNIDLILMDLQMPIMDGITATKEIRNRLKLVETPIIAMTANAMNSDREACLSVRMNDHVGKPFDINNLVAVIRRYAGLSIDESVINQPVHNHVNNIELDADYIQLNSAIARMGGNKELYKRMLPKFIDNLEKHPAQLKAQVDSGALREASRALHSLKGISATMGAIKISAEAARGEKLLISEISEQEAKEFVDKFNTLVSQQLSKVRSLAEEL